MNFKTIRKVGIPALLTGTFVLSAEDSSGAPTYKEATIATLTASRHDDSGNGCRLASGADGIQPFLYLDYDMLRYHLRSNGSAKN